MNQSHKDEERQSVDRFVAAWEGRDAIASIKPGESPDFAGTLTDGRPFGLEVVTVTDKGLAWAEDVIHTKFKPELLAEATAASLNMIFALYFGEWQERPLADGAHRRKLITDLVEFARGAGGQVRETDDADPFDESDSARDIVSVEGVEKVLVEPADDGPDVWIFRNGRGRGWNEINEFIKAKGLKADDYRKNLAPGAQLWLLLVAGTTYANGVEIPPRHLAFETTFDRLFFLDHWPVRSGKSTDRVAELPIRIRV